MEINIVIPTVTELDKGDPTPCSECERALPLGGMITVTKDNVTGVVCSIGCLANFLK